MKENSTTSNSGKYFAPMLYTVVRLCTESSILASSDIEVNAELDNEGQEKSGWYDDVSSYWEEN